MVPKWVSIYNRVRTKRGTKSPFVSTLAFASAADTCPRAVPTGEGVTLSLHAQVTGWHKNYNFNNLACSSPNFRQGYHCPHGAVTFCFVRFLVSSFSSSELCSRRDVEEVITLGVGGVCSGKENLIEPMMVHDELLTLREPKQESLGHKMKLFPPGSGVGPENYVLVPRLYEQGQHWLIKQCGIGGPSFICPFLIS